MSDNNNNTMSIDNEAHLEPRVARLETGLEQLSQNVNNLTSNVSRLSENIEGKFEKISIGIADARAPKRTDWALLISIGFFIMALGAAVLVPLNQNASNNKVNIEKYHELLLEHQKLDMHPMGLAKVEALVKDADMTKIELVKRDENLDQKIQKETQLMTDLLSARLDALDKRLQVELGLKADISKAELNSTISRQSIINEKLYQRIDNLEAVNKLFSDKERDELRQWRSKAMGLSTPDLEIPLVKRSDSIDVKK